MKLAGVVWLLGKGELRCVGEQVRRACRVPHAQHRGGRERCLQRVEALLLGVAPCEACSGAAQGSQRGGIGGEVPHELTIVISEAHEAAHVRARRGRGPLCNRSDLAAQVPGVDGDAALRDDMAEEAHGGAAELALRPLGVELVVPNGFKHHAHMRQVLVTGLGDDQDVIAIDLNEAPQHQRARAERAGGGDAARRYGAYSASAPRTCREGRRRRLGTPTGRLGRGMTSCTGSPPGSPP